ncbi:hypothetical protein Baya_5897 [Bagarius yarrelli]|uniref:Uncharacterized protein n=1 Tax=Bagarius yarrelli TaxID=175774 RepID=A0A556TXV1_BAGYA|nr:hypothetical protein Baya_5897 [Bagarius yarrelli]
MRLLKWTGLRSAMEIPGMIGWKVETGKVRDLEHWRETKGELADEINLNYCGTSFSRGCISLTGPRLPRRTALLSSGTEM